MHNLLTSIVLCFVAHTATAQCVNAPTATPVSAQARPGAELIKTAAADTRDGPALRQSTATATHKDAANGGDEHRRPTGAMLLAALALMSAIALRRSAPDQ